MTKKGALIILLLCIIWGSGCGGNFKLPTSSSVSDNAPLLRVEIVFVDNNVITGYVNCLGVDPQAKVLVGGSSVNNLYDVQGNIIGCFNYNNVLYMKVLPLSENSG